MPAPPIPPVDHLLLRRSIWIIVTALTLSHVWSQEGRGGGRGGPPPDPVSAERGRGAYSANCSFCHGPQASGTDQAPSLVRNQLLNQDNNGDVLGPIIRQGRPSKGMPAFAALPAQSITDIIAFLRTRAMEARGVVPETALLVGDAKAGQAYFNGAGGCNKCHSVTGDLARVRTK